MMDKKLRIPRVSQVKDGRQITRHTEIVGWLLNGLINAGILIQGDVDSFGIAGLWFDGSGPPSASLGVPGDYYLDTVAGILYKKQ